MEEESWKKIWNPESMTMVMVERASDKGSRTNNTSLRRPNFNSLFRTDINNVLKTKKQFANDNTANEEENQISIKNSLILMRGSMN